MSWGFDIVAVVAQLGDVMQVWSPALVLWHASGATKRKTNLFPKGKKKMSWLKIGTRYSAHWVGWQFGLPLAGNFCWSPLSSLKYLWSTAGYTEVPAKVLSWDGPFLLHVSLAFSKANLGFTVRKRGEERVEGVQKHIPSFLSPSVIPGSHRPAQI